MMQEAPLGVRHIVVLSWVQVVIYSSKLYISFDIDVKYTVDKVQRALICYTFVMAISYTLKRYKKSKTLKLKIRADGEVIVTAPFRLSKSHIETFVLENSAWLKEKLDYLASLPEPHIKTQKGDYRKYKEQARALVHDKIKKINAHYNFIFKTIAIRNQKTRWGSCSAKKTLSFNYKIALIPEHFVEYIVAHELCHLKEMNHGPRFWKLVAETIPEYQKVQLELKNLRI